MWAVLGDCLVATSSDKEQLAICRSLCLLATGVTVSAPGGAGHALLFRDHVLLKKDFKVGGLPSSPRTRVASSPLMHPRNAVVQGPNSTRSRVMARRSDHWADRAPVLSTMQDFPSTALTFEAWISASDFCHAG